MHNNISNKVLHHIISTGLHTQLVNMEMIRLSVPSCDTTLDQNGKATKYEIKVNDGTVGEILNIRHDILVVKRDDRMFHTDNEGNKLYPWEYLVVSAFYGKDEETSRSIVAEMSMCHLINRKGERKSERYNFISATRSDLVYKCVLLNYDPMGFQKLLYIDYNGRVLHPYKVHNRIGSRGDDLEVYVVAGDNFYFVTGCFVGSLEEFEQAVKQTHSKLAWHYEEDKIVFDAQVEGKVEYNMHGREYMELISEYYEKRRALYGK